VRPRRTRCLDRLIELDHGLLDPIEAVEDRPGQLGVVSIEVALQCLGQVRDLAPHLALGHLGQHPRIGLAIDHRAEDRPRRDRLE